jgi:hypothetical protein
MQWEVVSRGYKVGLVLIIQFDGIYSSSGDPVCTRRYTSTDALRTHQKQLKYCEIW